MQAFLDGFCICFANYFSQFFKACLADTGHAPEFLQQSGFPFFSDAFDVVERRGYLTFAPFVPVESDGKPVHFILDIFQQMEEGRSLFYAYRLWGESEQNFRGPVLVVLGQSDDWN